MDVLRAPGVGRVVVFALMGRLPFGTLPLSIILFMRHEGYEEYSPVYCASALGYFEGALRLMKVPGPVHVFEVSCQCAGDPACVFDLSW